MFPLVEFPELVQHYAPFFDGVFSEPAFIDFQRYVSGLVALTGYPTHPALFLFLIYVLTMRVCLLVDVGNSFAEHKHFDRADVVYHLAGRLWPDHSSKLIIQLNQTVMSMQRGATDDAIAALTGIL